VIAPPPSWSPWQRLYEGGHRLRWSWYRRRAVHLPVPVLSIGNLHWGGGGKTPVVRAVAGWARDQGHRVCILSRGYGRQGAEPAMVSRGEGPLLPVAAAGDEPVLLARDLPGVAVVVGAQRAAAGRFALGALGWEPDLFVLDDGFSHLALARDLDILVFPAGDPFAGGRLLPSGRLREPLSSSRRASAVLLTGAAPSASASLGHDLAVALRPYGFAGPGFSSRAEMGMPTLPGGALLAAGTPVLAVCGVARPAEFMSAVRGLHFAVVAEMILPDHHPYPPRTLERIRSTARAAGAQAVITTGKDAVKLAGRLSLPVAELPLLARPEPAFWPWLASALAALRPWSSGAPTS
jgi:tetraacyldisaccharide 4'-kinase